MPNISETLNVRTNAKGRQQKIRFALKEQMAADNVTKPTKKKAPTVTQQRKVEEQARVVQQTLKQHIRDFTRCPRCGAATEASQTLSGDFSQFWRECTKCNTYINTYIPQDHQQLFHEDPHRFKGNFGGYGSGKTTTSREEVYKHMILTPGGTGLIGANISAQYEQTIKRDIEADFPVGLIKDVSIKNSYIELTNGYRLMFRPFDDPGKLRSLNLDMLVIVEGSEVDEQVFTIGKTRVRNIAASLPLKVNGEPQYTLSPQGVPIPIIAYDWRQLIVESNPDSGWIKQDILLRSNYIQFNGNPNERMDQYDILDEDKDPAVSSHVTTTSCNAFLPPTYMTDVARGRPQWWINRYLLGSFTYSEGLVYPSALYNARTQTNHIIPTAPIPRHWKRVHANDYGLSDENGMLWVAIDEDRGKLIVYREYKQNNRNIAELAKIVKDYSADVPQGGWARPHLIDPKSGLKRDYQKKTLIDHYLDYGISYVPGQVSVDARVFKTNTFFEQDKIEIMDNCVELIKELRDYKFPSDLNKDSGRKDKPEDKNNHLINPLEWIVMALPADLSAMLYGVYDVTGRDVTQLQQQRQDEYAYAQEIFNIPTRSQGVKPINQEQDDASYFRGSGSSIFKGGLY